MTATSFRYSRTDHYDPSEPLLDGQYEVYDRETGAHLGTIIRNDSTPNGYHGRWYSGRLGGSSRDDVARQLARRAAERNS